MPDASLTTTPTLLALMMIALSIAVASLVAALFLHVRSRGDEKTSGSSKKLGSHPDSGSGACSGPPQQHGSAGRPEVVGGPGSARSDTPTSAGVAAGSLQGGARPKAERQLAASRKKSAKAETAAVAAATEAKTVVPSSHDRASGSRGGSVDDRPAAPKAGATQASYSHKLVGSHELWLLRTLAVQRLVDQAIEPRGASSGSEAALRLAELGKKLKRRVWDFLDDRPRLVATGCADGQARVFDLRSGKMLVSIRHDFSSRQALGAVLLDPRGPQLLTASWDGKWHTWDEWPHKPALKNGEFGRGEPGVGHENLVTGLALSRDGKLLACACTAGRVLVYRADCPTVKVTVKTADEINALRDALKMGDHDELYLKGALELGGTPLERDFSLLSEADFEGHSSRRDLLELELPAHLHFRFVGCLTNGHRRHWRQLEHKGAVNGLALCAEKAGEFLYTGSRDRTVQKWNLADGTAMHTYTGHSSFVRCVAVNGTYLASGGDDRTVRIWRKDEPTCLQTLKAHKDFVRALAFCHTFQERLVSSGDDKRVLLWDVSNGDQIREYFHDKDPLVVTLRLHESLLFTAAEDRRLRVWNTERAECQQLLRHPGAVTALSVL